MAKASRLENIYVELDVLLDTRLGTLGTIDPSLAENVLLNTEYRSRKSDIFPGVDYELYKQKYAKRDINTLRMSVLTEMSTTFLKGLVIKLVEQAAVRPYHDGCNLMVNVHPYRLTENENDENGLDQQDLEIYRELITGLLGNLCSVQMVNYSYEELTPRFCKDTFSAMIMYDFLAWSNLHSEEFTKIRLPEVMVFSPPLFKDKEYSEDELKKITKEALHPFHSMVVLASHLFSLQLVDVRYFSILDPNATTA